MLRKLNAELMYSSACISYFMDLQVILRPSKKIQAF
jgi:hypothetical protein